jgi:DNA polymerase III epsilon subunit-like protein
METEANMDHIVLDLEFNQSFDFKKRAQGKTIKECPFEIIQIGAVKLNSKLEITERFSFLIKPQIYKKIHPIVERITGISNDTIKDRPYFMDGFDEFCKFMGSTDCILYTWGIDDIRSLFRNILYFKCDLDKITNKYINIQPTAAKLLCATTGGTIGLKTAAEQFDIKCDLKFHDALNDAYYTALIMKKIFEVLPEPSVFVKSDIAPKIKEHIKIDSKGLIAFFEKSLERKLTSEEIAIILTSYKFGRNRKYDKVSAKK